MRLTRKASRKQTGSVSIGLVNRKEVGIIMELSDQARSEIAEMINNGNSELRRALEALTLSFSQSQRTDTRPLAESTTVPGTQQAQGNSAGHSIFGTSFFSTTNDVSETPRKTLLNSVDLPKYNGEPDKAATWLRRY